MDWRQKPRRRKYPIAVGDRFGTLVVVDVSAFAKKKNKLQCDCGNEHFATSGHLRAGHVQSCGCQKNQMISAAHFKHGLKRTVEYNAWCKIRSRCENPKDKRYGYYGARGIKVCERWQKFENFLADMGKRPVEKTSIDRIANDGNYEPGNCRWADAFEQMRNRRSVRLLTMDGVTLSVPAWSDKIGIPGKIIRQRISRGWPVEKALSTYTALSPHAPA